MGKGGCEDVSSAVDIQGDPADPSGPLVDELALGGRGGCGHLFGKVGGIEVASVANEHAHTFDIGEEALTGCWSAAACVGRVAARPARTPNAPIPRLTRAASPGVMA